MALTVKQLISKLKKLDQNAIVAWQDHDHSENEMNGYVNFVNEADESLLDVERDYLEQYNATNIVTIRP